MKKILLVEDDAVISGIYSIKLSQAGFEVVVAVDGAAAMQQLPRLKPDLVILDIVMPKVSGVEVLRFIRKDPQLKAIKVVVFSNAFLNNVAEQLTALGVEEMLLKSAVTPGQVIKTINTLLEAPGRAASDVKPSEPAILHEAPPEYNGPRETAADFMQRIRRDFFERIPVIVQELRQSMADFLNSKDSLDQSRKLEAFSRRIGFLTHMTGMAGCYRLAQLSSAFEALLFELREQPSNVNESSRHTIAATVDLFADCLPRADQADEQCLSPTSILVVDDDAVSNRALLFALNRYRLSAFSVLEPFAALEKLRQNSYDIVLLDIQLPGMDGISLCEQMRRLPAHKSTPVIFLTSYMEFAPRARAILRGGDDLIAKPILPIELTVKVIATTLRRRLFGGAAQP